MTQKNDIRVQSLSHVYQRKFRTFEFEGQWKEAFGNPETTGIWIVFGKDKNGKTWFDILLAAYLSTFKKVLYVSAEEGISMAFQQTCKRAKIGPEYNHLHVLPYVEWTELAMIIDRREGARIVFIDNCTIYADELKKSEFLDFISGHPNHLFVFIAHEERNEPYTALARLIKKLAKIIVHVEGLTCAVSGRCPGGILTIDEQKAKLYWGNSITQ